MLFIQPLRPGYTHDAALQKFTRADGANPAHVDMGGSGLALMQVSGLEVVSLRFVDAGCAGGAC